MCPVISLLGTIEAVGAVRRRKGAGVSYNGGAHACGVDFSIPFITVLAEISAIQRTQCKDVI